MLRSKKLHDHINQPIDDDDDDAAGLIPSFLGPTPANIIESSPIYIFLSCTIYYSFCIIIHNICYVTYDMAPWDLLYQSKL